MHFPIWCNVKFSLLFVLFNAVKTDTKLTLHHVGNFFLLFNHRRLKFYAVTHNNPKNPENSHFVIAGKTLGLSIFDNFGAQLQAPVI